MVKMKALRDFPYAGKRLKKGDEFDCRGESDAKTLSAVGFAQRHVPVVVVAAPVTPTISYATRALVTPRPYVRRAEVDKPVEKPAEKPEKPVAAEKPTEKTTTRRQSRDE